MNMACRGVRGATTAENTAESIRSATRELLQRIVEANDIKAEQVAATFFTTTKDLTAAFPATAARIDMGWQDVALLDAHEIDVPGSLDRCIRALLLVNTDKPASELVHVYLRGASNLRPRVADSMEH